MKNVKKGGKGERERKILLVTKTSKLAKMALTGKKRKRFFHARDFFQGKKNTAGRGRGSKLIETKAER